MLRSEIKFRVENLKVPVCEDVDLIQLAQSRLSG